MKRWLKDNRRLLSGLTLMVLMTSLGLGFYALLGRRLVEAMYQQRAWDWLNRLIEGRNVHPLEHYLQEADHLAISASGFVILTALLLYMVIMRLDGQSLAAMGFRSLRELTANLIRSGKAEFSGRWRWHAWGLLLIVWAGVWARWWHLDQPIRFDEAYAATHYAGQPPWQFLGLLYYYPNNHLFHTLLVWISRSLLGLSAWSIRLPAFLAGSLLPLAGYMLARCWYGRWPALLSAGLLAGSSILIEFSANARGYTWLLLLVLAISWLAAQPRFADSPGDWFLLAILASLGMWTIPVMLHPWAILMLGLLLAGIGGMMRMPSGSFLRLWLLSCVLTISLTLWLYWPILTISGFKAVAANRFLVRLPMREYLLVMPRHLEELWSQWHRDLPWGMPAILLIGLLAALWRDRMARGRIPWLIPTAIWLIPISLLQRTIYVSPRIWLFLLPWYLISAAGGIVFMIRWALDAFRVRRPVWATPLVTIAIVTLSGGLMTGVVIRGSVLDSRETGVFADAEAAVESLKQVLRPGDRVICSDPSLVPMVFYFECHRMPAAWQERKGESIERYWIVVDGARGETLEKVLAYPGGGRTRPLDSTQARLHKQINQTMIYLIPGTERNIQETRPIAPAPQPVQTRSLGE